MFGDGGDGQKQIFTCHIPIIIILIGLGRTYVGVRQIVIFWQSTNTRRVRSSGPIFGCVVGHTRGKSFSVIFDEK